MRRILSEEWEGYPLRKDYSIIQQDARWVQENLGHRKRTVIPNAGRHLFRLHRTRPHMGPQHPSTHGVLRVILKLDGEKVLGTDCVIATCTRVEKIAENRTYTQFNPYVDRMDYVAAISNGLGYCLAVEKMRTWKRRRGAQAVRVILTELNRIASHTAVAGHARARYRAVTPLFYCLRERRKRSNLRNYCGARLTTHAFRIGGLLYETYDGFEREVKAFCKMFGPRVDGNTRNCSPTTASG